MNEFLYYEMQTIHKETCAYTVQFSLN